MFNVFTIFAKITGVCKFFQEKPFTFVLMPLYRHHRADGYEWAIWKTDESVDDLLSLLPVEGREAYVVGMERFTSVSRRCEWLAVRVLLFQLLGEMKSVCYTSGGKPFLADGSAHLSISHTKGYVAVIISRQYEVGIDIEQTGERVRKVAHKFVSEDEYTGTRDELSTQSLLLLWSAKEVMFKCMDTPAVDFREHLFVSLPHAEEPFMYARESRTQLRREFRIEYLLHPDFVMTWTCCFLV